MFAIRRSNNRFFSLKLEDSVVEKVVSAETVQHQPMKMLGIPIHSFQNEFLKTLQNYEIKLVRTFIFQKIRVTFITDS